MATEGVTLSGSFLTRLITDSTLEKSALRRGRRCKGKPKTLRQKDRWKKPTRLNWQSIVTKQYSVFLSSFSGQFEEESERNGLK